MDHACRRVIAFFVLANLVRGATGRRFRMVRDNEVAARLSGIDVARTQCSPT